MGNRGVSERMMEPEGVRLVWEGCLVRWAGRRAGNQGTRLELEAGGRRREGEGSIKSPTRRAADRGPGKVIRRQDKISRAARRLVFPMALAMMMMMMCFDQGGSDGGYFFSVPAEPTHVRPRVTSRS